jgi:nucleotide-binding universal stress UspA family protein
MGNLRPVIPNAEQRMATTVKELGYTELCSDESSELDTTARARGPLIVATDTTTASDSAMRLAHTIAYRSHCAVIVVSVHVPMPMSAPEMQMAVPPSMEADRREALRGQVKDQLFRTGIDEDWQVVIATGDPSATIVRVARENEASLVIMGLGEHGLFDRLLGDETVIRVLRLGTVPVLAVAPGFEDLPGRVLATTDFTPSSIRAASLAADLMSPGGTLTLAHVLSDDVDPANWQSTNAGYNGTLGRAFDLAISRIGIGQPENIERCVLAGDPGRALARLVNATRPDLIVAGSHGHGFLTRLRLGSVSQQLVRGAKCSVLVAPPEEGPSFLDEVPAATTRFAAYEWSERLEEFTRRNTGRIATLEVIDPEIGAQIEEKGFPFIGAAFDPRDGQVQVMVGDFDGNRHLTRNIMGVTAVQVLRDRQGRDMLLRVAHGRGQTLLTLER